MKGDTRQLPIRIFFRNMLYTLLTPHLYSFITLRILFPHPRTNGIKKSQYPCLHSSENYIYNFFPIK